MATINEVISKHYNELREKVNADVVVSMGRTGEDILQDVCVTAMRKFKDKQIDEDEGLGYLKKTLFTEQHFQLARLKREIVIYTDSIEDIADH